MPTFDIKVSSLGISLDSSEKRVGTGHEAFETEELSDFESNNVPDDSVSNFRGSGIAVSLCVAGARTLHSGGSGSGLSKAGASRK